MSGAPILVVDDTPINLRLMRLLLTHEGYDVRTAQCAEDAVEMLAHYRPELILADIQLPGMSGLDMTRKVKSNPQTRAIRVVALTACNMKEDRDNALRAGCEDYISKPIDTTALAAKVRDLLARPTAKPAPVAAVTKAVAAAADTNVLAIGAPEVESLRRRFLNEGTERSRQLLKNVDGSFDPLQTGAQLHKWAGSAALLGHPEIGAMSRRGEELLRQEPVDRSAIRDVLTELFVIFAELRDANGVTLPEHLIAATSGKRAALIGFAAEPADTMCGFLERMKALPMLFDAADASASEAIKNCEMAVFHVSQKTCEHPWLQSTTPPPAVKRLVFLGERIELLALPNEVRSRAVEVLAEGGDPDEVLMRLAFALSNQRIAPAAPAVKPESPAPGRARTSVASPNVVLADDDSIIVALTSSALQNHGMCCRASDNGIDALKMIRAEQPHVAVLDVNMPGMSGFEVLAAVRAEKIPTRVILLTALQQEDEILRGFRLGADDYLTKPFSPFELVARLKRFLL